MINLDFIGLLILIAGFVIGLGAVTVIDIHGFLGRASHYWTEATTRTHKITKPMIWVGIGLVSIGSVIFFRNHSLIGVPLYLTLIICVLVLNGLFLSFRVSPYLLEKERKGRADALVSRSWQKKITASFIISDTGWWTALILVVWHLTSK